MMGDKKIPPQNSILLNVLQVCEYLGGISEGKVWQLCAAGHLPAPVKLGRITRWRRADLDEFADRLEPDMR